MERREQIKSAAEKATCGVCAKDSCPIKLECLRWHLGTNKNHQAVWLAGGPNVGTKDCEFFINNKEE